VGVSLEKVARRCGDGWCACVRTMRKGGRAWSRNVGWDRVCSVLCEIEMVIRMSRERAVLATSEAFVVQREEEL
jgi:hypothetical protein